ncbi:hypothetical protein AB0M43_35760 [Longispora sp. NPDC051575]|uniref:NACHT domain-containing protein n=1 Tax=Longispora sp. NPDC051575 TaxID=3154943 RepID=UPI0034238193
MPDYDLNRLGSRAFEQMIVALARLEIGPGVQVFGDGPDGGREATFDGTIDWSATVKAGSGLETVWTGYTVFQSKFQVKPKPTPHDNAVWLQNEIGGEIARWLKAATRRTRSRLPDYLIFVTNIDLSAVAETGGIDLLNTFIDKKLADPDVVKSRLNIKGVRIWHAEQVRSMLDGHQSVRWAFPGLITVGDALALAGASSEIGTMEFEDPLRQELLRSLRQDRYVRLSQSGGSGDSKLWLDDIAIDLPVYIDLVDGAGQFDMAVRHVLELGDQVLRQRQPDRAKRHGVVLVGGPGHGKSTLSQLIAQAYRVAILADADVGPQAQEIIDSTTRALAGLGLQVPGNRRWPVRVDLAKYAEELSSGSDTSLLRWISTIILNRTEQDIQPAQLLRWLRAWPWALILDGLDEVPSIESRRLVYQRIEGLHATAEDLDADLLTIVTTRPTGYDERLPDTAFEHAALQQLSTGAAESFARRITDKRLSGDDEMRRKVAERMRDAAMDPATARLMRTPLQVTIMSFIVEKFPHLPPDRFSLFNLYYTTICEREAAKEIPIARYIAANRSQIDRLHQEVGLVLQAQAESGSGAEAVLAPERLGEIASQQLLDRGFNAAAAARDASRLVEAATKRLVLLTPRDGGIGFEVRTLQELMAARAIAEGADGDVLERLRVIAHHPHWRNTWLLTVGDLLGRSERFQKLVLRLLRTLDTDTRRLASRFPSAPLLTADVLADNLAARNPNFERALIQLFLTVLARPLPRGDRDAAAAMNYLAQVHRKIVFDKLESCATESAASRAAATLALMDMESMTRDHYSHESRIRQAVERISLSDQEKLAVSSWLGVPGRGAELWVDGVAVDPAYHLVVDRLATIAAEAGLAEPALGTLRAALERILGRSEYRTTIGEPSYAFLVGQTALDDTEPILQALADDDTASALELALGSLGSTHWTIEAALGYALKPALDRLPAAEALLLLITESRKDETNLD